YPLETLGVDLDAMARRCAVRGCVESFQARHAARQMLADALLARVHAQHGLPAVLRRGEQLEQAALDVELLRRHEGVGRDAGRADPIGTERPLLVCLPV